VAELLQTPSPERGRLTATCHVPDTADAGLGLLDAAMRRVLECRELEKRLLTAVRKGEIAADHPAERIEEALAAGVIDEDEAGELRALYELLMAVIGVDDFDSADLRAGRGRGAGSRKGGKRTAKRATGKGAKPRKKAGS
jgi:acyl-CoA dehydrogenase